jgi:hypothetical protein
MVEIGRSHCWHHCSLECDVAIDFLIPWLFVMWLAGKISPAFQDWLKAKIPEIP